MSRSIFWRPAGRDWSVIDELACPVHRWRYIPAYWVEPRLQSPSRALAPFHQRVGLSPDQVACSLCGSDSAAAHRLERARDCKRGAAGWPRANQAVGEREALAPDMVDHRMVGRRAGLELGEAGIGEPRASRTQ